MEPLPVKARIERVPIGKTKIKGWCNDNNVGRESFDQAYHDVCNSYNLSQWLPIAKTLSSRFAKGLIVEIRRLHLETLVQCGTHALLVGGLPSHLKEDFDEVVDYCCSAIAKEVKRVEEEGRKVDSEDKWFLRLDECSPKDSGEPVTIGPYTLSPADVRRMLTAIITSKRCHVSMNTCRHKKSRTTSLVLLPWSTSFGFNEWRVFVHKHSITAMSQYHWHTEIPRLQDDEVVRQEASAIVKAHRERYKEALSAIHSSYILDLAVVDGEAEFVEINPFGAEYCSGSALFQWTRDRRALYRTADSTEARSEEKEEEKEKDENTSPQATAKENDVDIVVRVAGPGSAEVCQ